MRKDGGYMINYDEVQAKYFERNVRESLMSIETITDRIAFDKLSTEEFFLINNVLTSANEVINFIANNQKS